MGIDLKLKSMICDFEQAFINAVGHEVYMFLLSHLYHLKTFSFFHGCNLAIRDIHYRMLAPLLPVLLQESTETRSYDSV
jgi:hypothetical protein